MNFTNNNSYLGDKILVQSRSSLPVVSFFISSPGDVKREREITNEVLQHLQQTEYSNKLILDPFFWENELKEAGKDYQEQVKDPSIFDVFLCILGQRMGTPLHPEKYKKKDGTAYLSGTEYEFELAINNYIAKETPRILLFIKTSNLSFERNSETIESLEQYKLLINFCNTHLMDSNNPGVYISAVNQFTDEYHFRKVITNQIRKVLNNFLTDEFKSAIKKTWCDNPYMGLSAFDYKHAPIFYGRKNDSEILYERIQEQITKGKPFLLIGGSSGVGKSSLLRAGLLPLLLCPHSSWRYAELRPSEIRDGEKDFADVLASAFTKKRIFNNTGSYGSQTHLNLPSALPELLTDRVPLSTLSGIIRESIDIFVGNITSCLDTLTTEQTQLFTNSENLSIRLCLVIDQLEEFFTLKEISFKEKQAFFKALSYLVKSGAVVVIGSIRSDCLANCEHFPDLLDLKDGLGYFHLASPPIDTLASIISEPAKVAGVTFEVSSGDEKDENGNRVEKGTKLNDFIMTKVLEASSDSTILPILEFMLSELYVCTTNEVVNNQQVIFTYKNYFKIGGLLGALAKKADEVMSTFTKKHGDKISDKTFSLIMRYLVIKQPNGTYSKKKALRSKYEHVINDTLEYNFPTIDNNIYAIELVNLFVDARLFVISDDGEKIYVHIAHEILFTSWETLGSWLKSEDEYLTLKARFMSEFTLWEGENKSKEYLLRAGKALQDAEFLLKNYNEHFEDQYIKFIKASRKLANRNKRRLKFFVATLSILLFVSTFLGFYSYHRYTESEKSRNIAENLVSFMLFDLSTKLREIDELSLMEDALAQIDRFYTNTVIHKEESMRRLIYLDNLRNEITPFGLHGIVGDSSSYSMISHALYMTNTLLTHDLNYELRSSDPIEFDYMYLNDMKLESKNLIEIERNILQKNTESYNTYYKLARLLIIYSKTLEYTEKSNASKVALVEAIDILKQLRKVSDTLPNWKLSIFVAYETLTLFTAYSEGFTSDAVLKLYEESLQFAYELSDEHKDDVDYYRDIYLILYDLAMFYIETKPEKSKEYLDEAIILAKKLSTSYPNIADYQNELITLESERIILD